LKTLISYIKYLAKTPLLLGVFVFFISCENDIEEVRELTTKQDSAIISATNVKMQYTTNGQTDVIMETPLLQRFIESNGETYLEFPDGIHLYFYNDSGTVTSTLKANYSIYYEDKGRWIAKYNVEAVNEKGEKLNTEYLVWQRDKEQISSDQFVKLTTNEGVIYGDDGFVANQTFTSWEVINGRGELNINTDE